MIGGEGMARKKSNNEGGGGPNWLDTYADMVTLLLTFFVMLFAMSTMNASKWQQLVEAFATNKQPDKKTVQAVGMSSKASPAAVSSKKEDKNKDVTKVESFDDLYDYLKNYIKENKLEDSVQVHKGDDYTFITFQNSIFFDGDSSVLRADGKKILDFLSEGLKPIPKEIGEVRFYGHTARAGGSKTVEQQAFDRTLSSDRAKNVLLYVQYKNILHPSKMVSEGYGEYRPIVPHDGTEETRKKNRRVEIYISKTGKVSSVLDTVYEDIKKSENK